MVEIDIKLSRIAKEFINLSDKEFEILNKNFEGVKQSITQQIETYLNIELENLKYLKEEIEK